MFGLLQTRVYATTIIRSLEDPAAPGDTLDRYVQLRMDRQEILSREHPPRITAIIDESAIRRRIGGPAVMRAQLHHLLEMAKRPTIDLRVLDHHQAVHAGIHGPFTVFAMPDPYPAVAYVENLAGRLYVEMPKAEKFVRAYDALLEAALDPREHRPGCCPAQ